MNIAKVTLCKWFDCICIYLELKNTIGLINCAHGTIVDIQAYVVGEFDIYKGIKYLRQVKIRNFSQIDVLHIRTVHI